MNSKKTINDNNIGAKLSEDTYIRVTSKILIQMKMDLTKSGSATLFLTVDLFVPEGRNQVEALVNLKELGHVTHRPAEYVQYTFTWYYRLVSCTVSLIFAR